MDLKQITQNKPDLTITEQRDESCQVVGPVEFPHLVGFVLHLLPDVHSSHLGRRGYRTTGGCNLHATNQRCLFKYVLDIELPAINAWKGKSRKHSGRFCFFDAEKNALAVVTTT